MISVLGVCELCSFSQFCVCGNSYRHSYVTLDIADVNGRLRINVSNHTEDALERVHGPPGTRFASLYSAFPCAGAGRVLAQRRGRV